MFLTSQIDTNTESDKFDSVVAFAQILVVLLIPFVSFILLIIMRNELALESIKNRFGALYSDTKLEVPGYNSLKFMLWMQLFMLRRLIFSVSVVFGENWSLMQIQVYIITSLIVISSLVHIRPYKESFMNGLEFFNELCILLIAWCLPLFTFLFDYPDEQYQLGWVIVFITILNIIVNMAIVFISLISSIKVTLKNLRQKYRLWQSSRQKKYQLAETSTIQTENFFSQSSTLTRMMTLKETSQNDNGIKFDNMILQNQFNTLSQTSIDKKQEENKIGPNKSLVLFPHQTMQAQINNFGKSRKPKNEVDIKEELQQQKRPERLMDRLKDDVVKDESIWKEETGSSFVGENRFQNEDSKWELQMKRLKQIRKIQTSKEDDDKLQNLQRVKDIPIVSLTQIKSKERIKRLNKIPNLRFKNATQKQKDLDGSQCEDIWIDEQFGRLDLKSKGRKTHKQRNNDTLKQDKNYLIKEDDNIWDSF